MHPFSSVVSIVVVVFCCLLTITFLPFRRVSYCTVDPYYDKVFCYICRNGETKKLECHAFLCSKRSKVCKIC